MSQVTQILHAIAGGDPSWASQFLPLVYDELRQLAARKLARERSGQTLQPTALVHEAYLRLVGDQKFEGRGHFFAAAAEAMRRILIEAARRKQLPRHGGGQLRWAEVHDRSGNSEAPCSDNVVAAAIPCARVSAGRRLPMDS
jgi:RNA polymerase sigma factor (TIGR02999 family)